MSCAAQSLRLERPRIGDDRSTAIIIVMFLMMGSIVAPVAIVSSGGLEPWGQIVRLPRFVETILALTVLCIAVPFLLQHRS